MGRVNLCSRIESMEDSLDSWTAEPIKGPRLAAKLAHVFQLNAEDILGRWRTHRSSRRSLHLLEYGEFLDEFVARHDASDSTARGVFARGRECDLWGDRERASKTLGR